MSTAPARRTRRRPRSLDDELTRIATMLRLSRNGGFALLSYDHADQLDGWLAAIKQCLGDATFVRVPVPESGIKIATEIDALATRSEVATAPLPIFVIAGIEQLEPDARTLLITNLNRMRTHLAGVAYPLLFCGDNSVLGEIVHEAPDLFDRIGLWADLRGFAPPAIAPAPTLPPEQQYRETLVRRLRLVEFRGILSINKPVTLPLTEFYVPLQAEQQIVTERLPERLASDFFHERFDADSLPPERRPERLVKTRALAVAEAVRDHRTLVVLGDPGAGKSTLLRSLALAAAEAVPERTGLPNHERGWLPILVPCAAYGTALAHTPTLSLLEFIECLLVEEYALDGAQQLVQAALAEQRALLLLDGLDEVQVSERSRVAHTVNAFVAAHCNTAAGNRAVISSRIVGYDAASIGDADATVTLRDFAQPQIEQFLKTWCMAYEKFARGDVPEARIDGERQATQLVGELASNAGARRLAGNPLLLTIMALIQRQGVKMPERRVKLYDIACQTLIETWNRARSLSGVALLSMPDPQLTTALLGELALWMQQHDLTTAAADDLLPVLVESYQKRGHSTPEAAAAAFLYDVQRFSGLLVERGPDQYSFLHLTFQEYFAARSLATRFDAEQRWRIIRPRLHDPRWRETILLTAGELGIRMEREQEVTDHATRILHATPAPSKLTLALFERRRLWWLLRDSQIDQIEEHLLKRNLLLVGEMLADDVGIAYRTATHIVQMLNTLWRSSTIRQQRTQTAAIIKRLPERLRSEVEESLLAALSNPHSSGRVDAARELGALGQASPPVTDGLLAALTDRDDRVRSSAAHALGALGQASPPVIDGLLAVLTDPKDNVRVGGLENSVRRSAARALGTLGQSRSMVVTARRAALTDRDDRVRESAARALGALGQASPPVIDGLLAALTDRDDRVRESAAHTLGELGQASPPVIDGLLALLTNPKDNVRVGGLENSVRRNAARALGTLGQSNSLVMTALLAALTDPEDNVRGSAALALGTLVEASPPVIDGLLVALLDRDDRVRESAAHALEELGQASPPVIDGLLVALTDRDDRVRESAAHALGELGQASPPVIDGLLTTLTDRDNSARRSAAGALGTLGHASSPVVAALLDMLTDPERSLRWRAALALGTLGHASRPVIDGLLAALRGRNRMARQCAAGALGALGQSSPKVINQLLTALADPDGGVRKDAAFTLAKFGQRTRRVQLTLLSDLKNPYFNRSYRLLIGEESDLAGAG